MNIQNRKAEIEYIRNLGRKLVAEADQFQSIVVAFTKGDIDPYTGKGHTIEQYGDPYQAYSLSNVALNKIWEDIRP
jgi:hypothetical protein